MTIKSDQTKRQAEALAAYLQTNGGKYNRAQIIEALDLEDDKTWRRVREYATYHNLICKTAGGFGTEYYHEDHKNEVLKQVALDTAAKKADRQAKARQANRDKAARKALIAANPPQPITKYGAQLVREVKTKDAHVRWFSYARAA